MKPIIVIVSLLLLNVGWQVTMAKSVTSVCEAVKEKAWKAKQRVRERQRAVQLARSETRLAYNQLVECRPGAVFSAGRAYRCAHAQTEVPLQVRVQLDLEGRLYEALADYQEKIEWVKEEKCTQDDLIVDQKELSIRIVSLENEIRALKGLIEQLRAD